MTKGEGVKRQPYTAADGDTEERADRDGRDGDTEDGQRWALTGTLRTDRDGRDENGNGNIFLQFFLENLGNK